MAEFEVKGINYKSTKLPLKPAVSLLLKIGPLGLAKDRSSIASALMVMPEENVHEIIAICLASCEREMPNGKGWAKVWNKSADQPMFDDIGVMEAGSIVMNVLTDNYADFLPGQS